MSFNASVHARGLVKAGPHPNIVEVYQVTKVLDPETNTVVEAVVMQWLDGKSLGQRLGESPLLNAQEAASICNGILDGITHLHSNDVTHSDLHLGNVVLTAHGPRIIDIDYSSAQSLARMTTLAREHRIQADIAQVAHVVGMLVLRTAIDQQFYKEHEDALRVAATVGEVRAFVEGAFAQPHQRAGSPGQRPHLEPPPRANSPQSYLAGALSDSGRSLADDVEAAIEGRQKATLRRRVMGVAGEIANALAGAKYSASGPISKELLRERAASYKTEIRPLLPALGSLGYWGGRFPNSLTVEAIERLANAHEKNPLESGITGYLNLRNYPVASALYAAGVGAVAGGNYRGVFGMLRNTVLYRNGREKRRLWTELAYWSAEQRELWNHVLGRDMHFPVSQLLEGDLRDALAGILPSDLRYVEMFDRFELFASLEHFLRNGRALGVSFLWRRQGRRAGSDLVAEIREEAAAAGDSWVPLKAGLLEGSNEGAALDVLDRFRESVAELSGAYHIW
jgi:tRNA A-37 threonylcarbamoyl transferase component Bud32